MKRSYAVPLTFAGSCIALSTFYFSRNVLNSKNKQIENKSCNNQTKTYIWGNGVYQARPDAMMRFRNYEPKLIKTFLGKENINLKDITFGENHEGGIDIYGNAYIWKKHKLDSSVSEGDDERPDIMSLNQNRDNKQIIFSSKFIWILKENGEVFQHTIIDQTKFKTELPIEVSILKTPKKVGELKNIVQIAAGENHFVALDKDGFIWAMGDDTLGQCGQGGQKRNTAPPFFEKAYKNPVKINLPNITKITCGSNHTLAINMDGVVFGWGSNSNIQLSHQQEFSAAENPLIAVFSPIRIEKNLGPVVVTDIAAGDEFSIFVGRNRYTGESELYGCGHNLHGELGTGNLSHIQEVTKIQSLSNYKVKTPDGDKDIKIDQLSCGKNHCMALLNIGPALIWGANEHGQLGNRKRVFSENPIVVGNLTSENILKISCGFDNSAIICENKDGNGKQK